MNRGKKQVGQQHGIQPKYIQNNGLLASVHAVALHRPQSSAGRRWRANLVCPLPGRLRSAPGE
jgi:hypothetical protein